jgi:hypothetical protein
MLLFGQQPGVIDVAIDKLDSFSSTILGMIQFTYDLSVKDLISEVGRVRALERFLTVSLRSPALMP